MASPRLRVASRVSARKRTDSSAAASSRFAASASAPLASSSPRCFALKDSAAARRASRRTEARSRISFAARVISAMSLALPKLNAALAAKDCGSGFRSGCLCTSSRMNAPRSAMRRACASLSAESFPCRFIATSRLSLYALMVSCRSCTARSSSFTLPRVSSIVSLNCASRFWSSSVASVSSESRAARRRAVSATIASRRASIWPRFSTFPRSARISSCPTRIASSAAAICFWNKAIFSPNAVAARAFSSRRDRNFTAWSFWTLSLSLIKRNSLIFAPCSFLSLAMCSSALVYLVAEKISSNFFFRVAASPSGQLLSSWCTNTTFSKMALETPIMSGTVAFMSAHFRETLTRSPVFSSSV
mmetsp:Transcript_3511/g.12980  ORF Transcript_3511/g.12980 Transcript_3511/m.12980 type:complete len:360 (+) Transcript_3511:3902-4981(+)